MSKAKYQDNLETIQWLKRYIELNGTNGGGMGVYNAIERRNDADLYSISQAKKVLGNPFKTVVGTLGGSMSNNNNNSFVLNQSIYSTTTTGNTTNTPRARMSLKPRLSCYVSNKENTIPLSTTTTTVEMKKQKKSSTTTCSELKSTTTTKAKTTTK